MVAYGRHRTRITEEDETSARSPDDCLLQTQWGSDMIVVEAACGCDYDALVNTTNRVRKVF